MPLEKRAMNETQSHTMGIVWKCRWNRHLRTIERTASRVVMEDSLLLGEQDWHHGICHVTEIYLTFPGDGTAKIGSRPPVIRLTREPRPCTRQAYPRDAFGSSTDFIILENH